MSTRDTLNTIRTNLAECLAEIEEQFPGDEHKELYQALERAHCLAAMAAIEAAEQVQP